MARMGGSFCPMTIFNCCECLGMNFLCIALYLNELMLLYAPTFVCWISVDRGHASSKRRLA